MLWFRQSAPQHSISVSVSVSVSVAVPGSVPVPVSVSVSVSVSVAVSVPVVGSGSVAVPAGGPVRRGLANEFHAHARRVPCGVEGEALHRPAGGSAGRPQQTRGLQ